MSHTASQTSWSEYGHLSGTKGLNSSTRPGSQQQLARAREARAIALDEVRRLRGAHILQNRLAAAEQRAQMARSASMAQIVEAGRQREYQQQRAVQLKQEQENRKQLIAEKEHVAKARERRLKAQRVEAEKQRAQAEIANQNRQAEEKRQEMLAKVALQEVEVRKRLAGEIMQVDASVQQRKKAIAEKKEQVVLEAAQKLEQKLRRAQSAKSIREVTAMERVKAEAAFREGARDMRVHRAKVAKEQERLEYVRRNAEEEARRVRALEEVMKQEAQQKLRLVSSLVRQDTAAKSRLERTSGEKLKHTVELARQREEQIAKAAEAKVIREQRVREQIAAAAAIKEKERNERARRAMESKESQRLYYVQRNAMKDARFEQMGQEYFEAAMQSEGGLRPQTASAALESGGPGGGGRRLSRSASNVSSTPLAVGAMRPSTPPSKQWGSEMRLGGQPSASLGGAGLTGYAKPLTPPRTSESFDETRKSLDWMADGQ